MIFLNIFHCIIANLLCLANAVIITSFIKWKFALERILAIGLFCCIQIFLVSMLCGLIGLLGKPFIMTFLLLFLFLFLLILSIKKKKSIGIDIRGMSLGNKIGIGEKILLIFCFLELGWLLFIGFFFPPRAYDSLWYHLPIVVGWESYGNMWFHPGSIVGTVFPKNSEIFFLWNMIFLRSDTIVNLTQFTFLIWGTVCIMLISMELGLSLKYSLWSAGMFLFTPLLIVESVVCYVDIILLVFIIVTFYLFLRYIRTHCFTYLLLSSITCGLGMGVKYSGVYLLIILIFVLILSNLVKKQLLKKKTVYEIFTILFVSILLGGFWYILNFIKWHNPFWPIKISFLGINVFKGPKTLLEFTVFGPTVSTPTEYSHWGFFFKSILEKITHFYGTSTIGWNAGLGPQFLTMGILSSFVVFIKSIMSKQGTKILFFIFFIILFLSSGLKIPRFVLYLACLSSVSIALVFDYIKNIKLWKILMFLMIFYVFIMSFNHDFLTPHLIEKALSKPFREKRFMRTCDLFRKGEDNWKLCQKVKQYIPTDSNILCAGIRFSYILTENGFGRKLFYILPENKEQWYNKLYSLNIDFIVMKKSYHNNFDIIANPLVSDNVLKNELSWIRQDYQTFSIVDSVSNTLIIKVNRD